MNYLGVLLWNKIKPSSFWMKDGQPIRCTCCGSTLLYEEVTDTMCNIPCEFHVVCCECLSFIQEWHCGYYNQRNTKTPTWSYIFKQMKSQLLKGLTK